MIQLCDSILRILLFFFLVPSMCASWSGAPCHFCHCGYVSTGCGCDTTYMCPNTSAFYPMISKPFWSRSISSSALLIRPTPTNATCKDPGHRTLIFVICNCILHNVNDLETGFVSSKSKSKENRGRLREPRNNSEIKREACARPRSRESRTSCGETDVRILAERVKKLRRDKPQGRESDESTQCEKMGSIASFSYVQSILLVRQEEGKKGWHTIQEMGGLCAGKKTARQTRSCGSDDKGKQ